MPVTCAVLKLSGGRTTAGTDLLAGEEPLEIRLRGRPIVVTMRTPGQDAELAAGFLLTEGIVRRAADILRVEPCGRNDAGNVLNVTLAPEVPVDFERLTRHVFAASSCGVCGKATLEAVRHHFAPIVGGARVRASTLLGLPASLRAAQSAFDQTGGIHAAGLFAADGKAICVREDVGRHNAVDKAIGHALLSGASADVLLVSGRTSFEILQKSLAARIPIIAAISAPSSLAVEFAEEMGQTLIGFLREGRMNIYAHPGRVDLGS
jgi:FdhD protein